MPFTYGMMLIGSLSLVGFPFLMGFHSTDLVLELAAAKCTEGWRPARPGHPALNTK